MAEQIDTGYAHITAVIDRAVPVIVLEMDLSDGCARFTRVDLR